MLLVLSSKYDATFEVYELIVSSTDNRDGPMLFLYATVYGRSGTIAPAESSTVIPL